MNLLVATIAAAAAATSVQPEPECTSLLGKPLYRPTFSGLVNRSFSTNLHIATNNLNMCKLDGGQNPTTMNVCKFARPPLLIGGWRMGQRIQTTAFFFFFEC